MKGRLKNLFGGKREPAEPGSHMFEYAARAASAGLKIQHLWWVIV
jgi:hypothetical protein